MSNYLSVVIASDCILVGAKKLNCPLQSNKLFNEDMKVELRGEGVNKDANQCRTAYLLLEDPLTLDLK